MKLVAISDIHSNAPALEAVLEDAAQWGNDVQYVVAGDFLNIGPFPRETLELLYALPDPWIIAGNHEEYMLEQAAQRLTGEPFKPPYRAMFAPSGWTYSQLTEAEIEWLRHLPRQLKKAGPDGSEICIVHGSPRHQTEGLGPNLSEAALAEIFAGEIKPGRLWISGHIHRPVNRRWRGMTITSNGSVGIPIDGDIRPCYLRAEWDETRRDWRVEHRRVDYDRTRTLAGFERNAAYDRAGPYTRFFHNIVLTGRNIKVSHFNAAYIAGGDFPAPPDDMAHLDRAVTAHLSAENNLHHAKI